MEKETKHTPGRFSITDNLTAVINSQADRIIEAENSGKALLRIIERLEGQISEMKKENASLQSEIDRLNQENEGMRKEIMEQGDTIVSLGKVLLKPSEKEELSEMKKEREELVKEIEVVRDSHPKGSYAYNALNGVLSRIKK